MPILYGIKSTVFIWFLALSSCGNQPKTAEDTVETTIVKEELNVPKPIIVAANQTEKYIPLLKGKSVGLLPIKLV